MLATERQQSLAPQPAGGIELEIGDASGPTWCPGQPRRAGVEREGELEGKEGLSGFWSSVENDHTPDRHERVEEPGKRGARKGEVGAPGQESQRKEIIS